MNDLSIIIVSFNARGDLERCLTSIVDHPPRGAYQVIVVDNASTDGSAAAAREFPNVTVIESATNRGFAAANNIGIKASSGRLLLLLNSDTVVGASALDRMVEILEKRPDVGALGPRLIDGSGRAELSFGSMITPLVEWRRQQRMRALAANEPGAVAAVDAETKREQMTDWVSGACLLVRRRDADAVGLLDERFFLYTEDVDFCASLRARGKKILFVPTVEIVHFRGRSGAAAPAVTRAVYEQSHLAFYRKHYPLLAPIIWLYHRLR